MITLLNKFNGHYIIQKNDIYDIALSYIKENSVDLYLRDIVFSCDDNVIAHYNISKRIIVLNNNKLLEFSRKLYDGIKKIYLIDDSYSTYYINFFYLYIIYHELKHVTQKLICDSDLDVNNIYHYLYVLGLILQSNDSNFYKKNHDLFPMEIEANNYGFITSYNIMRQAQLPIKDLNIMYLQYLFSLTSNYEKISTYYIKSPIETLKEKSNIVDLGLVNELMNQKIILKNERVNLGLPITSREYNELEKEKYKILYKTI